MSQSRFLVLGMQRSGTTVTQQVVEGHPQVAMTWAEVAIEPFLSPGISAFTFGNEAYEERIKAYPALFDALTKLHATPRTKAHGLKVAANSHRESLVLANVLREYLSDVRLVLTVRRDLVAQFGSLVRARDTGVWHVKKADAGSGEFKVTLDRQEFVDYATDCLATIQQMRSLGDRVPMFEVSYEDDIVPGSDWAGLCEFLGVDVMPIQWLKMGKVSPPPDHYIENYHEMVEVLQGIEVPSIESEREVARDAVVASAKDELHYQVVRRAEYMLKNGDPSTACVLDAEVVMRPDIPRGLRMRAMLMIGTSLERIEDARLRDRVRADLAPSADDPESVLWRRGEFDASDVVDRIAEIAEEEAEEAILHLSTAARDQGFPMLTQRLIRAMLLSDRELSPSDKHWGCTLLCSALEILDDGDLALSAIAELEDRYRDVPAFCLLAGVVHFLLNRHDAARTWLDEALRLDPGNERAQQFLARL